MVLRQTNNIKIINQSQLKLDCYSRKEVVMKKEYNIGLDIGTSSVGWAIVEKDTQKIIKKAGKALWGVRLFDLAETAEMRRNFRSTRRRYDRRRSRIKLLQELFANSMNNIDPDFFKKLQESKYHKDDKQNKTVDISKEEKLLSIEYNKKYKTIYHLRKELIENPEKVDLRLVYLAIHHIIKYRGNFLYTNNSFDISSLNIEEKLSELFQNLCNVASLELPEDYSNFMSLSELSKILLLPSKTDIKEELKKTLEGICPKPFIEEFTKLINGNKFTFEKLLCLEDRESKTELSFKGTDYDDKYEEYETNLGAEIEILNLFKELYDALFLKKLFKGKEHSNLSSVMVDKYIQHEKDLRLIKDLFQNNRKLYDTILRTDPNGKEKCLYEQYISNKKTSAEFCSELTKLLIALFDSNGKIDPNTIEQYELDAKIRIANNEFLPRITDNENGKYPYQLNKDELIKIIENQGVYYPFLLEKTTDGTYKIVRILEFKIPYYVGPLVSEKRSAFAWMERKVDNVKITPYNFDEIIDKEKTAEKFIKRMIAHCTYLMDEYALPNSSILYSYFKVLNELKQIKVDDQKLSNEQQKTVIEELFKTTSGSVTNKKFQDYLRSKSDWNMSDYNVTGYSSDGKFANSLQSYNDFFGKNGIFENTSYNIEDAENIIEWVTIFTDKDILEAKVKKTYPELSENSIKSILNKKYSGWGKLSTKLLTTKYYKDKKSNIPKSILDLMIETKENFIQIINNDEYNFQQFIKEENKIVINKKVDYSLVKDLVTSPSVKRGIYQSLKVVEELVHIMGYEPSNIVIEMAREDAEKVRKDDKKRYLEKLYKNKKEEIEDYNKLSKQLEQNEIDSQKLFLYFIQEGKCLYSRTPLNIEDLDSYEIDHIIPRTLIKDDSIDNKALVIRECNQAKASNYILPKEYRNEKNQYWWNHLKKLGLMSAKKFHNLIRSNFSDDDIAGFINRQLVETRQITKHVAHILESLYNKSEVIYIKASLSHNYRERYQLYKFRQLNDYHHAHDAYLVAVLGEYKEKYMKYQINFDMVKELNEKFKTLGHKEKLKYGYVINSLDDEANSIVNQISAKLSEKNNKNEVFDAKRFNKTVEDTLYRNDILVSRKTEIRSGQFYNQTIYSKGKGNIPLKKNMPVEIYGGYSSTEISYLCLVKYGKKTKIIGIPIEIALLSKNDNSIKMNFIKNHLNEYEKVEIIKDYIPFETEMIFQNQKVYLKGYASNSKTNEICNARQLKIKKDQYIKWKEALNIILNKKKKDLSEIYKEIDEILQFLLDQKEHYPLFKTTLEKIDITNYNYEDKTLIIEQLIIMFQANSSNANLSSLNLGNRLGRLSGKNVNSGIIVSKSTTGFKESEYEF